MVFKYRCSSQGSRPLITPLHPLYMYVYPWYMRTHLQMKCSFETMKAEPARPTALSFFPLSPLRTCNKRSEFPLTLMPCSSAKPAFSLEQVPKATEISLFQLLFHAPPPLVSALFWSRSHLLPPRRRGMIRGYKSRDEHFLLKPV
jgi:hypothetical protein